MVNWSSVNTKFSRAALLTTVMGCLSIAVVASPQQALTPAQLTIQQQRQRLSSGDLEERRDALMRLGALNSAEASREALVGLTDDSPMIRAVAAKAILSIGAEQSVTALVPLLTDKDEFVRREVAYALGLSKSRSATEQLVSLLLNDKEDGVRAAAAVALGDVADERAVVPLASVLAPQSTSGTQTQRKIKTEKNIFVLRAAAKSLGQIKSRAGVPALVAVLSNEKLDNDVRREAAFALGLIGDPSALQALQLVVNAADPYLAETASNAVRQIKP